MTVIRAEVGTGEPRLGAAVGGGAVAALIGAGAWAAVTVATDYQIGWMAVAIGVFVGYTVRWLGRGTDARFGAIGALFALAGCTVGNLLAACGMIAATADTSFMEVVGRLDADMVIEIMTVTFAPIDLLFYGIALWEGWRLSLVPAPSPAPAPATAT